MGLSVRKLLSDYFTVEDLKDALSDINEPVSGTKDQLIGRLIRTWKEHNRGNYELFDYLDKTSLQMICYYYNLDPTPGSIDTYIRRIKRADLLNGSGRRKQSKREAVLKNNDEKPFRDLHVNIGTVKTSKYSKIGIVIGVAGVAATVIGVILSG